jgi:uncharacterized protein YdeI (YjbR/CyaY-like superfamily)
MKKGSTLTRKKNPMPVYIRKILVETKLTRSYQARPPYQRNDYLGWITRAKLEATRKKRLNQMLRELRNGDRYMKMAWKPGNNQSL